MNMTPHSPRATAEHSPPPPRPNSQCQYHSATPLAATPVPSDTDILTPT